jgi:hypothetical protein
MQKTAQKRNILNRLREMTNVSGIAAEKFFNPQFQEVMENVRSIDASIRAIATGQQIEGADPGESISLKDLLKSAKSNFNRREYMTAVAELARFHKKFFDITQQIDKLHNKVNEVHHQFLFQDVGDEHKKQLENLKTRWASDQQTALIKEASIMEFLHNIVDKRGRALAFYEKRYPKQIGKLKKDTTNLINKSEGMLSALISSLKEMATARATRNVDKYMGAASRITKGYGSYDEMFKTYYNDNVKSFLDKIQTAPTEKVEDKGMGKQEVPDLDLPAPSTVIKPPGSGDVSPQAITSFPSSIPLDLVNPSIPKSPRVPSGVGTIPPPPDTEPEGPPSGMESNPPLPETYYKPTMQGVAPQANTPAGYIPQHLPAGNIPVPRGTIPGGAKNPSTFVAPPRITLPVTSMHRNFVDTLEALSGEAPSIVASFIQKYAQSIQGQDTSTAIKLLQIVKSIRG